MLAPHPPYVIMTPVRDEMDGLPDLFSTVEKQFPRPQHWVVVDDHSRDGSWEWMTEEAKTRPWITVVRAPESASEYLGAHIARIKRWGLEQALSTADRLHPDDRPQFAGVLDADVLLPPDHYAKLLTVFADAPRLGVVSSLLVEEDEPAPKEIQRTDEPRGATQFFRRTCLDAMGGLLPYPGYDGASNIKARAVGYGTQLVTDVVAIHRREMATRFGAVEGYQRRGHYSWFLGLHPLMVFARGLSYSRQSGVQATKAYWSAWGKDALAREERCPDPDVRAGYGRRRLVEAVKATFRRQYSRRKKI